MLANTGNVSLWLYGSFIIITIIGMVVAYFVMLKGKIEAGKLDKMIELFKYAIVTVGLGTVALIVTDQFKERDQDLKELDYFDKYVDEVKRADSLQERVRLVKYLSIVAPSGEIKKSWEEYYKVVDTEYRQYLVLKAEKIITEQTSFDKSKDESTVEELVQKIKDQSILNAAERPLVSDAVPAGKPTIYIQYCDSRNKALMISIQKTLLDNSWKAPGIELVRTGCDNTIRYFHDEDRELADQANSLLNNKYLIKKVSLRAPKGQLELWAGD
jgi:hypothetical protein